MKSIFTDKNKVPSETDLKKALGTTYDSWKILSAHTQQLFSVATGQWNFASEKYGWSFRISDKKRVLIYLLPRDQFFKVAFVFGQKATDKIMRSDIAESIKTELAAAKVYAEGRGIRIDIIDQSLLEDIKKLITIKIEN